MRPTVWDRARPGLRLLAGQLRAGRRALLGIAAWSVLEAAPALAAGWAIAEAIDRGFLAHRIWIGMAWLGLLGAMHVLRAVAERALFRYFADLVEPMRDRLVRRVVAGTLTGGLRGSLHAGSAVDAASVARLTQQVEAVRGLVGALLRTVRPVSITVLAALAGLATLTPALLPLVLPPLAVALACYPATVRMLARRRRAVMLTDERLAAVTGTALLGARDVASLGAADLAAAQVRAAARDHAAATVAMARVTAVRVMLDTVGGSLPVVLVLLAGPWLIGHATVTAGQLVGAVTYLTAQLAPALRTLTGLVGGYFTQLSVVADRLAEIGAATPPVTAAKVSPGTAVPPRDGDLVLRGVSFAYGAHAAPVVSDLDLTVPSGGHLAVVGASGIGKSTLAALMAGLDVPDRGSVTLGGVDPARLPDTARGLRVAFLPQQAYVFAGTVRDNLRYLAPDAGDQALLAAAEAVGARHLIDRLGGCGAAIDDPAAALSAGERQQLALARAFVSPASLVILDEATCHLDHAAERRAERAFVARGGTVVVIAHRVGSAQRADRVLVLHEGGHATGRPAELALTCPPYAAILAAAAESGARAAPAGLAT